MGVRDIAARVALARASFVDPFNPVRAGSATVHATRPAVALPGFLMRILHNLLKINGVTSEVGMRSPQCVPRSEVEADASR